MNLNKNLFSEMFLYYFYYSFVIEQNVVKHAVKYIIFVQYVQFKPCIKNKLFCERNYYLRALVRVIIRYKFFALVYYFF